MLHIHSLKMHLLSATVSRHWPGVGFTVVNQTDVVPTLEDLKIEVGRQTCKWTV